MRNHCFVMSGLCFLLLIFSCNQKRQKNDREITSSVSATTRVIDENINVSVRNGVVTLNGEVADEETKTAAVNAVKHIEGVKSINDYLSLKPVSSSGGERVEDEKRKDSVEILRERGGRDSNPVRSE